MPSKKENGGRKSHKRPDVGLQRDKTSPLNPNKKPSYSNTTSPADMKRLRAGLDPKDATNY